MPSKPWDAPAVTISSRLSLRERVSISLARAQRWEFWPAALFYIPIVVWIIWLGLKHRNATVFTAANPALDSGGMVGEQKHQALAPLQTHAPDLVATFVLLPADSLEQRLQQTLAFANSTDGGGFPLILKPNIGQRGRGVFIARNAADAREYLQRYPQAVIAQRYVAGQEFGVFIARNGSGAPLEVLSIVHKTFPSIRGDGVHNLRELILKNPRARLIAPGLLQHWAEQLQDIPAAGESRALVEIGAHCRGSLFLNASDLLTDELIQTLTRLIDAVPGYHFGRIDLRVPSAAHLQRGEGLQVLELNGASSESAHIYHPGTPLINGYRAMFRQWSRAFEVGSAQAKHGAKVTSAFELLQLFREDLKRGAQWF